MKEVDESMPSEFGLRGPKPSWTCPNDRQLALRAKLKSGWSLKTNQYNTYPKPQPLTEKEQQMIVSVVKKAEEMDLYEQKRVGKLVDRLESLKKLASGNGVTECVLCGDTFGLAMFGRSNYKCHDCDKAVCRKCVVDISSGPSPTAAKESMVRLCKLCAENRELIKKSGAWFYKGVPKYILPEKKNHYTNSYEKYAASPRYQEQKYVSRYINAAASPSTALSSATQSSSATTTSDGDGPAPTTTIPTAAAAAAAPHVSSISATPKSRTFFWSRNMPQKSQSEQDNESSSGDEGAAGFSTSPSHRRLTPVDGESKLILKSNSLSPSSSGTPPTRQAPRQGVPPEASGSAGISRSREHSPTPSRHSQKTAAARASPGLSGDERGCAISDGQPAHLSSSAEYADLSSSSSSRLRSTERFDLVGNGGTGNGGCARTSSGNGDNNVKSSGSSSTDCLYQPTTSTPSNSTCSAATTSQTSSTSVGMIEVALLYDDSHQALHCSVHHAKDLTPTDVNGLSDPYCILKLIPSRFEGTHLRTKTIAKSVNPIFNETLTFYGVTAHDLTWQTMQILVMDDDRWGKDCLGTTQIPLHRLRSQQTRCFSQSLERGRLSEEREWGRGRLLLSLTYLTEKSVLLVGVIQAQDLPALDHNGTSDPFVKVRLLHDTTLGALSTSCFSISRKFRTSVKWRTLNPEFREEFSLKVSIVDLPRLALVISVWDKDLGKNDDYIGGIVLSTGSKGERLKHWLDMMKLPNTKHFKWHTLSPSELPSH